MLSQHDYSRFVVYREHKGQSNLVQRQTQVEEENIRGIEENAEKEQELPFCGLLSKEENARTQGRKRHGLGIASTHTRAVCWVMHQVWLRCMPGRATSR